AHREGRVGLHRRGHLRLGLVVPERVQREQAAHEVLARLRRAAGDREGDRAERGRGVGVRGAGDEKDGEDEAALHARSIRPQPSRPPSKEPSPPGSAASIIARPPPSSPPMVLAALSLPLPTIAIGWSAGASACAASCAGAACSPPPKRLPTPCWTRSPAFS